MIGKEHYNINGPHNILWVIVADRKYRGPSLFHTHKVYNYNPFTMYIESTELVSLYTLDIVL